MTGQIRQGDVLLDPCDVAPPPGASHTSEAVLALGELTGHAHRLAADELLMWDQGGQTYVRVVGPAPGTISHEDHDPVPAAVVTPGQTYRVVRQQEYDLRGEWRKVQD